YLARAPDRHRAVALQQIPLLLGLTVHYGQRGRRGLCPSVQLDGVWVGAVGPGRLVKSGADAQAVCISEARIGQLAPHGIPEGSLMSLDSRFEKQLRGLVGRVQVDGDALE